jgi:hypothetical protein
MMAEQAPTERSATSTTPAPGLPSSISWGRRLLARAMIAVRLQTRAADARRRVSERRASTIQSTADSTAAETENGAVQPARAAQEVVAMSAKSDDGEIPSRAAQECVARFILARQPRLSYEVRMVLKRSIARARRLDPPSPLEFLTSSPSHPHVPLPAGARSGAIALSTTQPEMAGRIGEERAGGRGGGTQRAGEDQVGGEQVAPP